MCKQRTHLILLVMVLAAATGGAAFGFSPLDDPALIGWWTCDEGAGSTVADSSPNGHDGTFINGNPAWTPGVYGMAIDLVNPTLVEVPPMDLSLSEATMAAWTFLRGSQAEWASIIMHRTPGPASGFNILADFRLAYHWGDASNTWSYRGDAYYGDNEWTHAAVTVAADEAIFYVNGVAISTNSVSHGTIAWDGATWFGGDDTYGGERSMTDGALDDIAFFSRVLSEAEIVSMMMGLNDPVLAAGPSPADEATDVLRDADLSWTAGESAATHDVYLGTSFEDVNDASRDNPMDVLVSQDQAATSLDPGRLEFGQTYYWRVDEVNGAPDNTIFKGAVWSFEVEPLAYPVADVVVSSNMASDSDPANMVNGSGLNANDEHGILAEDMWVGIPGADPPYIQYEFDAVYKLHELLVWNYNVQFELMLGFGIKDATIEYSENGTDWVALGDAEFAQGTAMGGYAANTTVDLGGVAAKFVKFNVNSGYGLLGQYGLSEVRFLYIPVLASAPQPGDGAVNVAVDTMLSWRSGREAASHTVSLSTDEAAVVDGTAVVDSIDDASYAPAALDLATEYFWKVDEVNEAESISTWPGRVWSFTTQAFLVVDDFESYTEAEGNRVYEFWIDGWINGTGSTVGTFDAPFTEQTIVNGGGQSMPVIYDNAGVTVAEAVLTLDAAQDWTASGIKSLSVYFHGADDNTGQLYLKINDTKVVYSGSTVDLANASWQPWNVDLAATGANLSNVTELTIGIEGSGAAGVVYIDDIRLYPNEVETIMPVEPDAANLVLHYALDEGGGSVAADSSGNGNDGTIEGSPAWITGVTGSALGFDGSRDYITTGKSLLDSLPAFTIACWLKGDLSLGSRSGLVGQNDCVEYGVISNNTIQIWTPGGGSLNMDWPYDADTDWHSVVAVGDGASLTLYLDGKPAATGGSAVTDSYGTSTFSVNIGGGGVFDSADNWFTGDIDEIRIYQRALSAAEVAGLAGRTEPITMPF